VATTIKRSEHDGTNAHRALVAQQEREISAVLDRQKGEVADLDKRHAEARSRGTRYGQRTKGADEARRKFERKRLVEAHGRELEILKGGHTRDQEAMRRRHEREAAK